MRSHALYLPALVVAGIGAAIVPLGLFFERVRELLVRPLTLVAVGIMIVLFLRMLFATKIREGIDAANVELRGEKQWPRRFLPRPFDPEWRFIGSRVGDRPLQVIRAVCFAEFVVALILSRHDRPDLLFLAASSFGVTVILTIIHVGLNTEAEQL